MSGLRQIIERYTSVAGEFGQPVALQEFALERQETEKVFSGLDEDYHISRFLHFSRREGSVYNVNGEQVTHVSIDSEIRSVL